MHKIKRVARHHASSRNGNEANYNPFARVRTNSSQAVRSDDIERGTVPAPLNRGETYHSETCLEPVAESKRRSDYGPDNISPTHSKTMPLSGRRDRGMDGANSNVPIGLQWKDQTEESNVSSETTVVNDVGETDGKPRQRKLAGIMAKMHLSKGEKEKATVEPQRSDTSGSKHKFTVWNQIRGTVFNSWINVLLIAVPVGIAVNFAKVSPMVVFVVNFIAIIPLAALLSYATEEIALRTGETIGGLLNATFGNAVELIVSILALLKNEVLIVKTSLLGSILSNLLLVLGMCFFFGGLNRLEQFFNSVVAGTAASLLALAISALLIPTAFELVGSGIRLQEHVTALSRGTSIILLVVYGSYLFFQLKTHTEMYNEPSKKVPKRRVKTEKGDASKGIAEIGADIARGGGGQGQFMTRDEEDKDEPQLHIIVAVATLVISTALVGICAEFLVGSIDSITQSTGVSKTFVGLILLPIVGNAAEHATAVTVACKDKMDLAIGVAVGSSIQVALLIIPLLVVLGWILGKADMSLSFDGFQITILFVTVLLVNYLIGDGKSSWIEGTQLMCLYIIVAVAAWFYDSAG